MKKIIITIILVIITGTLFAQSPSDLYKYSHTNRLSTTARVAAMGGAFTSLGADASTIQINPAGLSLYSFNEISFSPSVKNTVVNNQVVDGIKTKTANTVFSLNNFFMGYTFPNYEKNTGFSFALSYNSDFSDNYKSNSYTNYASNSIVQHYSNQLIGSGLTHDDIIGTGPVGDSRADDVFYKYSDGSLWGAISTYNNGALLGNFKLDPRSFQSGDEYDLSKFTEEKTYTDNVDFAMSFRLNEYVSVGVTIGISLFKSKIFNDYYETKVNNNVGQFSSLTQSDGHVMQGTSYDLKIGVITEPIRNLRIGVAYHAPKATSIVDQYYIDQNISYKGNNGGLEIFDIKSPIRLSEYTLVSPSKLLLGASYVIAKRAIISFDYEKVWYGDMRIKNIGGSNILNNEIKSIYKSSNAFRIGAELSVHKSVFLRMGYAYTSSPFKENAKSSMFKEYNDSEMSITAGIGYHSLRGFFMDFAYIHNISKQSPSRYYESSLSPIALNRIIDNVYTLSIGWKF